MLCENVIWYFAIVASVVTVVDGEAETEDYIVIIGSSILGQAGSTIFSVVKHSGKVVTGVACTRIASAFSGSTVGQRAQLGKNLGTQSGEQAHHIIPWDLYKDGTGTRATLLSRLGLNSVENGVSLSCVKNSCGSVHLGSHAGYSDAVESFLDQVEAKQISDDAKKSLIFQGMDTARANLGRNGLPLNSASNLITSKEESSYFQQIWDSVFDSVLDTID